MSHHRWVDVPSEQITDAIARRFITGDSRDHRHASS